MNSIILLTSIIFTVTALSRLVYTLSKGFDPRGKIPINKFVFVLTKISTLTIYLSPIIFIFCFKISSSGYIKIVGTFFYSLGSLLALISFFNLDMIALKFGIPKDKTALKTTGLYSLSRNPMYVAFFIILIGATLITYNLVVLGLTIFVIIPHHFIVLKEEKFLATAFCGDWDKYIKKVRRYI